MILADPKLELLDGRHNRARTGSAAAGACIGFALNIAMQLVLSDVPDPDSKLWSGVTGVLVILSIFLAFHGWQKQDEGRTRLSEIEGQTEHEDC
jgi:hypothetical protein